MNLDGHCPDQHRPGARGTLYGCLMGRTSGLVAASLSIGAVVLTGCVSNTEKPDTFPATVTVVGNAEQADPQTGQCIIATIPVAPNDTVWIHGESAAAAARSVLEVDTVERDADGTRVCTYVAHFEAVPANQRGYTITVSRFESSSFHAGEIEEGATFYLHEFPPGSDPSGIGDGDRGGTP
ncbi:MULTISPECIES: hypothetical protein [Rhodococcus]|uniref:hypothetical protein n=1 Tax=Rhodococcus TaxID=1827 RepID=UPI00197F9E7A|nr:hypothetical protein [Rhodococcus sp. PSBB049]QSE72239.1 hypothetical protein JYA91_27940 [Rhodococcus sp. PSBB049]